MENRVILLVESRIHGDMYVRFGGRQGETYHRNVTRRSLSSLLMLYAEKQGYKLPVYCTFDRVIGLNFQKDKQGNRTPLKDENGEPLPQVSVQKGEKSFPVFITTFTVVDKETKAKIKYDDYKKLSDGEKQRYSVYPKMQVYSVFNVDQTNMKEARPELYAKIEEENQLVKPELNGEGFSFPAVDKMIEDNG